MLMLSLLLTSAFAQIAFAQVRVVEPVPPSSLPQNWFSVNIGATSFDVQAGWYDLGESSVAGRLTASYIHQDGRAYLLAAELLGFTGKRSGFYSGAGLALVAEGDFHFVVLGPQWTLGGDIALNERDGILLETSAGFYPFMLLDNRTPEEKLGMFFPLFVRLGVGYRRSF